jgi:hypothetical protein
MDYPTLVKKIKEEEDLIKSTRAKLKGLKNLLKTTFPTLEEAQPGDKLADGCVVIERYTKTILHNERLLIAAPKETQVCCAWGNEFTQVRVKLKKHGLNPPDWFLPSFDQLKLALKNAKHHFRFYWYWSSTEVDSFNAYFVSFCGGSHTSLNKMENGGVSAFRFIEL